MKRHSGDGEDKNTNICNRSINNYMKTFYEYLTESGNELPFIGELSYEEDIWDRWRKPLRDGTNTFGNIVINRHSMDRSITIFNDTRINHIIHQVKHNENGPAYERYYKDGKLEYKSYYINGKLHNPNGPAVKHYSENGQVYFKQYFINGFKVAAVDINEQTMSEIYLKLCPKFPDLSYDIIIHFKTVDNIFRGVKH
jgi:hypothetical protein